MGIRVERYTLPYVDAVRAFNGRLTARRAVPGFLLDETPPSSGDPPLRKEHFLAVETDGEVRGGFMLQRQTFSIGGTLASVANYQAPISEGIADRRYAYLGMLMVKEALRHDPLLFCLGMGGVAQPLPRLLAALGFSLRPVPFLFRVRRPSRVLRELPALRTGQRESAQWAALACWLNPALVLDGEGVGFLDAPRGIVILITCGASQCTSVDDAVVLAKNAFDKMKLLLPISQGAKP